MFKTSPNRRGMLIFLDQRTGTLALNAPTNVRGFARLKVERHPATRASTGVQLTAPYTVSLVPFAVSRLGSGWHVAQSTIVAPYRAFSREKLPARIGAHIGLMHINITLTALPVGNWTPPDIDFNERFSWNQANDMGNSYRDALQRGLPYPILTVAEYFSLGQEGFAWGGQYRAAGYYASILLW